MSHRGSPESSSLRAPGDGGGALHSSIVPRQSILPVTLQNPRRHWLHEDTRPGTAAGQPPQENGVPTPLSCSRLRPSTGLATEIASMKLSTIHTTRQPFRRCPRPAPPVDAQTSLHCLAENIARTQCGLPPASLPTFYSGHTPRHQGLKHFADQAKHRIPLRLLKSFLR